MATAATSSTLVQFRAGQLFARFNGRLGSPSVIAKRDLERYYFALDRSRAEAQLNFPEGVVVLEILKDIPLALPTARFAAAIIEEQLREASNFATTNWRLRRIIEFVNNIEYEAEQFAQQHNEQAHLVDFVFSRQSFGEKLQRLSFAQIIALWDAAEEWESTVQYWATIEEVDFGTNLVLSYLGVWQPSSSVAEGFVRWSQSLDGLNKYLAKKVQENESPSSSDAKTEE